LGGAATVDFSKPFIAAPVINKDGKSKIEVWRKFHRFCFAIGTPAFLETTLPTVASALGEYEVEEPEEETLPRP
jgi:hypothetical protein